MAMGPQVTTTMPQSRNKLWSGYMNPLYSSERPQVDTK